MPKAKACKSCGDKFEPFNSMAKVCSVKCAIDFEAERKKAGRLKAFNQETKRRREAIMTPRELIPKVQEQFNRFIKYRDWDKPCISCGEFYAEPINGVLWDCGHFLSIGSHPELRFCEFNAARQHSRCNRGAAKSPHNERTVSQQYEENLRARIGDDLVDWLKGPHEPAKYTADELRTLLRFYKARAQEFKKYMEAGQ